MADARPPLVGRSSEARELRRAIVELEHKLVIVAGERGAGKTTLAGEIFRMHRDSDFVMDFVGATLGHGRSLPELLAQMTIDFGGRAPDLSDDVSLAAEVSTEAERLGRGLYFIDNLETAVFDSAAFQDFAVRWVAGSHTVCLLVTMRTSEQGLRRATAAHASVHEMELSGLRERQAILHLLGDRMMLQHGPDQLLSVAQQLGNLPQRLLQLRWSGEDPEAYVARLGHSSQDGASAPLQTILAEAGLEPVLAGLGLLQRVEFDQALLRVLWDAQPDEPAGGFEAAEAFLLVEQRILSPATTREHAYRVHPTVLGDLAQLAERRDRQWTRRMHTALADYFGSQLRSDRPGIDIQSAQAFAHHGLQVGKEPEIWDMIFDDAGLEHWRRGGRSIEAAAILDEFWQFVSERKGLYSAQDRAELLLRQAHVASDLGRPRDCLRLLEQALDESAVDQGAHARAVRRAIWTQLAISHANLGDTNECLSYYLKVVEADSQVQDPKTALCMGYAAYEYCDILELERADKWSQLALDRCPRDRNASIFAKNLCNRGLVRFFLTDVAGAAASFEAAVELVSEPGSDGFDVREHGRVLAHLGMSTLSMPGGNLDEALDQLTQAKRLNQEAGDRRRTYVSMGRMGIAHWRLGARDHGKELLEEAALGHRQMGDMRNLAIEVLALLSLLDGENAHAVHPELAGVIANIAPGGPLERYRACWDRAYSAMLGPTRSPGVAR